MAIKAGKGIGHCRNRIPQTWIKQVWSILKLPYRSRIFYVYNLNELSTICISDKKW